MPEIGSGTGSSYPATLDTDATVEVNGPNANKTKARAEVVNDLAAAVVAIETELGTDPAGTLTNVKTFLQTEHETDGTHGAITPTGITLAGSAWPSFSVNKGGAGQSIDATTWTKVTWPTEAFDTNSNFASNTFTPTVAGKYLLSANIYLSGLVAGKILQISVYKNGVAAHTGAYLYQATTGDIATDVTAVIDANGTTDAFDVYVYHDDTVARSVSGTAVNTYFTGCRIG